MFGATGPRCRGSARQPINVIVTVVPIVGARVGGRVRAGLVGRAGGRVGEAGGRVRAGGASHQAPAV